MKLLFEAYALGLRGAWVVFPIQLFRVETVALSLGCLAHPIFQMHSFISGSHVFIIEFFLESYSHLYPNLDCRLTGHEKTLYNGSYFHYGIELAHCSHIFHMGPTQSLIVIRSTRELGFAQLIATISQIIAYAVSFQAYAVSFQVSSILFLRVLALISSVWALLASALLISVKKKR